MNCWVNIASMLAYRRLCIVICVEAPSAFIMIVSALNIGLENCHLSISFLRKHFLTVPVSLKSRRLPVGFFSTFPLISKPISSFRGLQSRVIIRSFTVWLPALCRVVCLSNVYVHSSNLRNDAHTCVCVCVRACVYLSLYVCVSWFLLFTKKSTRLHKKVDCSDFPTPFVSRPRLVRWLLIVYLSTCIVVYLLLSKVISSMVFIK